MKILRFIPFIALLIISCTKTEEVHEVETKISFEKVKAVVNPIAESGVMGMVTFSESEGGGVEITAELTGLEEGKHGFHIHQYGDCSASDGTSAGGHFNPLEKDHSNPEAMNRHMGDMGNIMANSEGKAELNYVDKTINIGMIIGRGIIVHAGEDDLSSQPSGAAGSRIACGVVGIAK